jgi:hypothetical protein
MASALNIFKTVTSEITTTDVSIYQAPTGFTGIILMAQIANVAEESASVTFLHVTSSDIKTELVKNFVIPPNDAASVITGKLILEEGSSVRVESSSNDVLKITLSILESLNA